MIELPAKKDIDKISIDILKGSKSFDIYPTPVDNIVSYAELIVRKDIDVSKIQESYLEKANTVLQNALSKIRGIFDRKEKMIYLDLSAGFNRKNFVKLHETAHGILPWQKEIHDILGDNDITLNPDNNEEFEAEANYFASVTLFQHERFNKELQKLGLNIDAAMQLARHFGASIHASLRRYIDCSNNRCALIILENLCKSPLSCALRNFLTSQKFQECFGDIDLPSKFDNSWPFVADYRFRKYKKNGLITLNTASGSVDFNYQFFNNTYNAFIFLYPVGEVKKSRTNIIVSGT